jgi:hypothetical protein
MCTAQHRHMCAHECLRLQSDLAQLSTAAQPVSCIAPDSSANSNYIRAVKLILLTVSQYLYETYQVGETDAKAQGVDHNQMATFIAEAGGMDKVSLH